MSSGNEVLNLGYGRRPAPPWGRWRTVWLSIALAVGWYVAAGGRTMDYGTSFRTVCAQGIVALIFAGPVTLVALADLRVRRLIAGLILVALAAVALAEAWAGGQEWLFARRCDRAPLASAFEARWWLFSDHHISYDPASGFYGGD